MILEHLFVNCIFFLIVILMLNCSIQLEFFYHSDCYPVSLSLHIALCSIFYLSLLKSILLLLESISINYI